ncbi:MAG: alpha/beta fold hydrolase [Patescibacteria group bacterium]
MKTSLHRILTKDNLELVGLLYEPEEKTSKILVHVHGMAGNFYENRFLDALAKTLTDNGIAFFAFNNRGCESLKYLTKTLPGGKKEYVRAGNSYEKFEDSLLDIQGAIDAVSLWGFNDIHLSGHSLGSPKVSYYLSQTQDKRVASLILLSPSDMLGLVRDEKETFERDINEARTLVKAGKGEELLSHEIWDECPLSANTYLSLFGDDSPVAIFNFFDPNFKLPVLGTITQPIFVTMGREDDCLTVSIEETMERITKASTQSSHVETKILGDANHGYIGFEDDLAQTVLTWIQKT